MAVVTGSGACVVEVESRKVIATVESEIYFFGAAVALSSDGKLVAISGSRQPRLNDTSISSPMLVQSFDTKSKQKIADLPGDGFGALAFSPSSSAGLLAICNGDEVMLYDTKQLKQCATLVADNKRIHSLGFSVDGTLLTTGHADGALRIWDVDERHELIALKLDEGPIGHVVFTNDNDVIRCATNKSVIELNLVYFDQHIDGHRPYFVKREIERVKKEQRKDAAEVFAQRLTQLDLLAEQTRAKLHDKLSVTEIAEEDNATSEGDHVLENAVKQGLFFKGLTLSIKNGPEAVNQFIESAVASRGDQASEPIDALIIGELHLVAGNPKSAKAAIRVAIQRDGSKGYFYKSLGWCLLAEGKTEEARQAFKKVLTDRPRKKDGTYDLDKADPDQMTAAYFLDLVTEQRYINHLANNKRLACFPWFYVAQRREIEGKKADAIKAYERCVELGSGDNPHTVRALAEWRLRKLKEPPKAGQK